jgi:F-type H+-transporting ATPase subunit b
MPRLRWITPFVAVLAVLVALAGRPASAQEGHGGEKAGEKAGHKDEHKKPNPIAPEWLDLGIWTLVVFLVLLWVLSKFAWKPMLEGLRKREQTIREAIEVAKQTREEMASERAEFERRLAEAHSEIPRLMEAARRDAQNLAEEMRTKAAQDIQADRQRLRREIDTARDQALKDLTDHAAQLATLISAKVIRRSLTPEDHRRLIDEALAELKEAQKGRGETKNGASAQS